MHQVQKGLQCSRIFDTQKILQTLGKPYKCTIKARLQNVTSNEEMVTGTAGELADLGEMFVDDVQVPFSSLEN